MKACSCLLLQLLLITVAVVYATATVPTAHMSCEDLVVRDGSLVRVDYTGFDGYSLVNVILYDTMDPSRRQLSHGSGPAGFRVFRVDNMGITASAKISVVPNSAPSGSYYAETPNTFEILRAPLP